MVFFSIINFHFIFRKWRWIHKITFVIKVWKCHEKTEENKKLNGKHQFSPDLNKYFIFLVSMVDNRTMNIRFFYKCIGMCVLRLFFFFIFFIFFPNGKLHSCIAAVGDVVIVATVAVVENFDCWYILIP